MSRLIFDIETIWIDYDLLDNTSKETLTHNIKLNSYSENDYNIWIEMIRSWLGFSPLTWEIVSIWVYDIDKNKWTIYYQSPWVTIEDFEEDNFKYKSMTEKEMIQKFWEWAKNYNELISFNWRNFDVPFILIRWAINSIKATKDLMTNKFGNYKNTWVIHIDLLDQLSFFWAIKRRWSLHLYCRAFWIKSPKESWINWENVTSLFRENRFFDIAKYNSWDLIATAKLYEYRSSYLKLSK